MTFISARIDFAAPPNERVALVAEQWLAPGPMAATLRTPDYEHFLDAFAGHGKAIKGVATSCGMFAGACLIHAGVLPPRPPPEKRAITTWVGLGAIGSKHWIPVDELPDGPIRGDILYVCSDAGSLTFGGKVYSWHRWQDALNGHVIVCRGTGWVAPTAEGGGSPGGTGCRLSAGPKELRKGRPPRGVFRPNLAAAPEPKHFEPLLVGSSGERVRAVQRIVGAKPDGSFGPLTRAAVAVWETSHGLTMDGIWGADNQREHDRA